MVEPIKINSEADLLDQNETFEVIKSEPDSSNETTSTGEIIQTGEAEIGNGESIVENLNDQEWKFIPEIMINAFNNETGEWNLNNESYLKIPDAYEIIDDNNEPALIDWPPAVLTPRTVTLFGEMKSDRMKKEKEDVRFEGYRPKCNCNTTFRERAYLLGLFPDHVNEKKTPSFAEFREVWRLAVLSDERIPVFMHPVLINSQWEKNAWNALNGMINSSTLWNTARFAGFSYNPLMDASMRDLEIMGLNELKRVNSRKSAGGSKSLSKKQKSLVKNRSKLVQRSMRTCSQSQTDDNVVSQIVSLLRQAKTSTPDNLKKWAKSVAQNLKDNNAGDPNNKNDLKFLIYLQEEIID